MKSLLEKAKAVRTNHAVSEATREEVELALAWAKGQISYTQARTALNGSKSNPMSAYCRLAIALRQYVKDKVL